MASFKRSAESVWTGSGKEGKGKLTTKSGALSNVAYATGMRFGEERGTNPEELLAAAHAGCFNMQLAFNLSNAGHPPEELRTTAEVKIESDDPGFSIKHITLNLKGRVSGISKQEFLKAAEAAKAGCPVSKLFKGSAEITLNTEFAD
jgi:osmotically inducible protein OsmC